MRSATLNIRGERSVTCRGDFDRHPSQGRCRPARRRSANFSAICRMRLSGPPNSSDTGAIPISRRCRCTASCSRSRTRSTPRTCARPAAATRATTSTSRRAITCWSNSCATRARSSSPRPSIPNTTAAPAIPAAATPGQGAALDARLSAQHLGRQSLESLRHHALGLARIKFGIGALGQHQHGDGEPRRGDARILPRPVQSQCGRADPAAQGDAGLRWRRDRRRHLLRPQRHSLPHHRRLRQGAGCAEGPGATATTIRAIPSPPCRARRC